MGAGADAGSVSRSQRIPCIHLGRYVRFNGVVINASMKTAAGHYQRTQNGKVKSFRVLANQA